MFLLRLLKHFSFFQNLASSLIASVSPVIEHNIGKYTAIKKAFYLTALENLDGDYLEFGVFTGSAMVFSTKINKKMKWINKSGTRFFGFDSFQGFGDVGTTEKHPFYRDDIFGVNFEKVKKNILRQSKGSDVQLIKGFFSDTLDHKHPQEYGIKKARIIFIDCDLKSPALSALNFCSQIIQEGTILIMDDYFSYKGNAELGISGAFSEFCKQNPEISWRNLYHYGYLGEAYICSGISKNKNQ